MRSGASAIGWCHWQAQRIIRVAEEGIAVARAEEMDRLRGVLREDPENLTALNELARLLMVDGELEEALPYFQRYLTLEPGDLDARREYAKLLAWMPETRREAAYELTMLRDHFEEDLDLALLRLEVLYWLQSVSEEELLEHEFLEEAFRQKIRANPRDVEAHLSMGRLYQLSQSWRNALHHYRRAIEIAPGDPQIQARIVEVRNSPEFQIAELRELILEDPMNTRLRLELAESLLDFELYSEAFDEASAILAIDGRHLEARRIQRFAQDLLERERGEQIRILRAAVRENPRDYLAQLELGRLLMWEGSYPEAIRRYQIYLRAYPDDLNARRNYSEMLSWLEEYREEAIREYRDLLAYYPEDDTLRLQYARVLTWDPMHWREAERELRDILFLEPDNVEAQVLLGDVYRYQGRYREARAMYEEVLYAEPLRPVRMERWERAPVQADRAVLGTEPFYREDAPALPVRRTSPAGSTRGADRVRSFDVERSTFQRVPPIPGSEERDWNFMEEPRARAPVSRGRAARDRAFSEPAPRPPAPSRTWERDTTRRDLDRDGVSRGWDRDAIPTPAPQRPAPRTERRSTVPSLPPPPETRPRPTPEARPTPVPTPTPQPTPPPPPSRLPPATTPNPWEGFGPHVEVNGAKSEFLLAANAETSRPIGADNPSQPLPARVRPQVQTRPGTSELMTASNPSLPERNLSSSEFSIGQIQMAKATVTPPPRPAPTPVSPREVPQVTVPRESPRAELPPLPWDPPVQRDFAPALLEERTTVLTGLEDYYQQAMAGLLAIEQELRSSASFIIGWSGDNEDYSEFQFGARYNHYLNDGTLLYFGYSFFNFRQSGAPISRVSANVLTAGARSRLASYFIGSAELSYNQYTSGLGGSLTGFLRGDFEINPENTAYVELRRYDVIHEVKTVESLVEGIEATRIRIGWDSDPRRRVEGRDFFQRLFFEGHLSYAAFSDGNRQTSLLLRPYYRLLDDPAIDLVAGWRSFSYSRESPFYWSPQSYQGPLVGIRVAGDTFWDLYYDLRLEVFFPGNTGGAASSLSLYLGREFTQNISGGVSLFLSESPREDDFTYQNYSVLFDLLWRF